MYKVYLGSVLLPVAPSKIDLKIKNQNKTVSLLNEGEINILKSAGLSEFSFDVFVPSNDYPFTINRLQVTDILSALEQLKVTKKPFQFIVNRDKYSTNIKVSLEDYTIKEDAKNGTDVTISVKLKQYKDYGTKILKPAKKQEKKGNVYEEIKGSKGAKVTIGCNVIVNGRLHRDSYGKGAGQTRTNYRGKINYINLKGSHPYHVTTPSGAWQGWVTADSVEVV